MRRRRGWAALLLFLAALLPAAGAQAWQRAAVRTPQSDAAAPLYAAPDQKSQTVMTYYSGAPVQVLRAAGADMYQVQAGTKEAGVIGYMHADDLVVGDACDRQVQPCYMALEFNRSTPVYAYCDEDARVIGTCEPEKTYYAMGKNDGNWVQLYLPPREHVWQETERMECGFVRLKTGLARGYWQELNSWEVEPQPGDLNEAQVLEAALILLENASGGLPQIYTERTALEKMGRRSYLRQMAGRSGVQGWWVYIYEREGSDAAYAYVPPDGQGGYAYYIGPDDWGMYDVEPAL